MFLTSRLGPYLSTLLMNTTAHILSTKTLTSTHTPAHAHSHMLSHTLTHGPDPLHPLLPHCMGFRLSEGRQEPPASSVHPHHPQQPCPEPDWPASCPITSLCLRGLVKAHFTDAETLLTVMMSQGPFICGLQRNSTHEFTGSEEDAPGPCPSAARERGCGRETRDEEIRSPELTS